jgi:hypothetical protein
MSKKSRAIKRVLGLNRKSEQRNHGGIEHLTPSKITGWIISCSEPFHEVRLLAGSHLLARTDVNQPREDVSNKFNFSGYPGFSLPLPQQLPPIDWDQPIRLLAMSIDGRHQAELSLLRNPHKTREQIQSLLQSETLGMDGHFDGIIHGAIQGWAAKRGQQQPAIVWLQCEGREPIPLICDQIREGMDSLDLPRQCGFRVLLGEIPVDWKGLSLKCSFDRNGLFTLPQNNPIFMPLLARTEVFNNSRSNSAIGYQKEIASSSDLQIHWEELEMLRLILDDVEQKLDNRDRAHAAQPAAPSTPKSWIKRMLGIK